MQKIELKKGISVTLDHEGNLEIKNGQNQTIENSKLLNILLFTLLKKLNNSLKG